MKLSHILIAGAMTLTGLMVASCHSKDSEKVDAEEQNTQLTAALQDHDMARVSLIADSMAMYIDELTPDETVTVLMAFLEIHNNAVQSGDRKKDLETLRKFVDVYDIALSLNPADFKAAVAHARSINPNVDMTRIVADFRDKLAEYEANSGEPEPEPEAKADSVTITTSSDESAQPVTPEEGPDVQPVD